MSENGEKNYGVFFCHGSADKHKVEKELKPKLEETGAYVFLDDGEIQFGDDFREKIIAGLIACDEIVVFLTKTSVKRPWVFAEVGAGVIQKKRIVAIRYGPSKVKLQKLGVLSLLGNTRILEMEEFDDYVSQLLKRVKEVANA